jgi:hypothetical protein
VMAGAYNDLSHDLHGFLYNAGAITNVDFPGSTQTAVFGINDAGDIAGISFSILDVAGATGTLLTRVSNEGNLTGVFVDALKENHGLTAH